MKRLEGKLVHDGRMDDLNELLEQQNVVANALNKKMNELSSITNDLISYDTIDYPNMTEFLLNRVSVLNSKTRAMNQLIEELSELKSQIVVLNDEINLVDEN